jgi:hypothetical protein
MDNQLPELSQYQLDCLRRFLHFEIEAEDLRPILSPLVTFTLDSPGNDQTVNFSAAIPIHPVRITPQDLDFAIERAKSGEISERRLQQWATMLLMNDAFGWDESDESEVVERLTEFSASSFRDTP